MTKKPSDKLSTVPAKSQIFETLVTTPGRTQEDVAFQVECFTDTELGEYLLACHGFHRTMTTPAAALLIKRYQAARKRKELFLGFRNFDKMCPAVTGFSSMQIRNYAEGYATPPKAAAKVIAPLTAQEVQDKLDAAALEAKVQATIDAAKRQADADRKRAEETYTTQQKAAEEGEFTPPAPIVVASVPVNLVAAKTQRLYEEAVLLIRDLLNVRPPAGGLDKEEKAVRKNAINFLNANCGGVEVAPFPKEKANTEAA